MHMQLTEEADGILVANACICD